MNYENMMEYGWAIVVVCAGIGAIIYFGFISPETLLPEPDETKCEAICDNVGMEYTGEYILYDNNTVECICKLHYIYQPTGEDSLQE